MTSINLVTTLHNAVGEGDAHLALSVLTEASKSSDALSAAAAVAAEWSAEHRDRLRWLLVGWRDAGHVSQALDGCLAASKIWPSDPIFAVETLVILQDRARETVGMFADFRADLLPAVAESPAVDLLLGLRAAQDGDFEVARQSLKRIGKTTDESLRHFAIQFQDLGRLSIMQTAREALMSPPENANAFSERLIDDLADYFAIIDRFSVLEHVMRGVVFFNVLRLSNEAHLAIEALMKIRDGLSLDGRSTLLMLLNAYRRFDDGIEIVRRTIENENFRTSAHFLKAAVICAGHLRDSPMERFLLSRIEFGSVSDNENLERARRYEVAERRRAIAADRPLNIFFGLFGQLRTSDQIIPTTIARLSAELSSSREGPFNACFGISTWEKSGSRAFSSDQAYGFFLQILPAPVRRLIDPRFGVTGSELSYFYPNLIATCVTYMNERADQAVAHPMLKSILPKGSSTYIDDEDIVEAEALAALGWKNVAPDRVVLNQYKMWSRISRLKDALLEQEAAAGMRMDACMLLRTDLDYFHGNVANILCRAAANYDQEKIFCDHDPHAEYIEGAGDRYMIASRENIELLFQGYAYHLSVSASLGERGAGRIRMTGHQTLHAMLFEHGRTATPVDGVHYDLYRGVVPSEVLLPVLIADAAACRHKEALDLINAAVDDIRSDLALEAPQAVSS